MITNNCIYFLLPDLTTVEEFVHNKPLFLSDIPVHREFHSDHAVFFSNASDFIELLKKPHRSSGFSSYTDSAKLTLDLLEDYLNSVL